MDASIKIPCTFFSTKTLDLLLPNSAVAEVMANQLIQPININSPQWVEGLLQWQEKTVVVINFDKLESKSNNPENNKFIIIVRNPLYSGTDNNVSFFGISIHSTPHVIEANSHNLDKNLQPTITHTHAASYATINNKHVIIPSINLIISSIEKHQIQVASG